MSTGTVLPLLSSDLGLTAFSYKTVLLTLEFCLQCVIVLISVACGHVLMFILRRAQWLGIHLIFRRSQLATCLGWHVWGKPNLPFRYTQCAGGIANSDFQKSGAWA